MRSLLYSYVLQNKDVLEKVYMYLCLVLFNSTQPLRNAHINFQLPNYSGSGRVSDKQVCLVYKKCRFQKCTPNSIQIHLTLIGLSVKVKTSPSTYLSNWIRSRQQDEKLADPLRHERGGQSPAEANGLFEFGVKCFANLNFAATRTTNSRMTRDLTSLRCRRDSHAAVPLLSGSGVPTHFLSKSCATQITILIP